jgi:hypothetical protein
MSSSGPALAEVATNLFCIALNATQNNGYESHTAFSGLDGEGVCGTVLSRLCRADQLEDEFRIRRCCYDYLCIHSENHRFAHFAIHSPSQLCALTKCSKRFSTHYHQQVTHQKTCD